MSEPHGEGRFPQSRWSAIVAARSDDPLEQERALETLISLYWKPVYKYIRLKWGRNNEDAKDLTQGFFTTVLEKDFFGHYDRAKPGFEHTCAGALMGMSRTRLSLRGG